MTWQELLNWVNTRSTTKQELQNCASGLGLNTTGRKSDLRTRIATHANAQTNDLNDPAPWTPANMPTATSDHSWLMPVLGLAAVAALIIGLFVWSPWDKKDSSSTTATVSPTTMVPTSVTPDTTVAPDTTATPTTVNPTPTTVTPATAPTTMVTTASTAPITNYPGTSSVNVAQQSNDMLAYAPLVAPDPNLQPVFPDVQYGNRPALVGYESPFEDADFCDNTPCNMDVPQYYYRVMTAGTITIPELGIDCQSTDTKGCLVIVVNHFGETAMYRDNVIDHGFTVAGRVWDMSSPDKVTLASQALVDHYVGRMLPQADNFNAGANCGTIDGCDSVEWHVVVIGNGSVQIHWTGLYTL